MFTKFNACKVTHYTVLTLIEKRCRNIIPYASGIAYVYVHVQPGWIALHSVQRYVEDTDHHLTHLGVNNYYCYCPQKLSHPIESGTCSLVPPAFQCISACNIEELGMGLGTSLKDMYFQDIKMEKATNLSKDHKCYKPCFFICHPINHAYA